MEGDINQKLLKEKKGAEVTVADEVTVRDRVWSETKKIWVVAGPAIFTRFSTFGINVISQAFIGHIGPTELAAYSIVNTVFLRFSTGILVCFITTFLLSVVWYQTFAYMSDLIRLKILYGLWRFSPSRYGCECRLKYLDGRYREKLWTMEPILGMMTKGLGKVGWGVSPFPPPFLFGLGKTDVRQE